MNRFEPASTDRLDQSLRPVAEAIASGDAVLFPCNGLSMSVGAPSWEQLVEPLRAELTPSTTEADPRLIAQFYRNQHGDNRFFLRLREILKKKALNPGPVHRALVELPVNVVLTTNFDDLLERAFTEAGRSVHVISNDSEIAIWDERTEVQVIKLHGDLNRAETIVLSDEDYSRFLSENTAMRHKLIDFLRFRNVIFLGCSLRDNDIGLIHSESMDGSNGLGRSAFNITFENDAHRLREWRRRGIEPVCLEQFADETMGEALTRVLRRLNWLVQSIKGECDVLVVDDDEIFRQFLPIIIGSKDPGLRVEVAKNGYEAAKKMSELKPRVVIVDACLDGPGSLKGYNGFKFIESFRSDPQYHDVHFIIVSGYLEGNEMPGTKVSIGTMAKRENIPFLQKLNANDTLFTMIRDRLNRTMAA